MEKQIDDTGDITEPNEVRFDIFEAANGFKVVVATLAAEKRLNALSLDMIRALAKQLSLWQQDENVACVILKGQGERAFCAGGDIQRLYQALTEGAESSVKYGKNFFGEEYQLDYLIYTFNKPIICLGSGIVMGGGLGLMAGASHRVVTETTVMAMPEISIGLFPDVGAGWFLNKSPAGCGLFLGLTGTKVKAADALFSGLADYFVPEERINNLIDDLVALPWCSDIRKQHKIVTTFLKSQTSMQYGASMLWHNIAELQQALLNISSPEQALSELKRLALKESWFEKAISTLEKGCPLSAVVFIEQMHRAKHLSLKQVFNMELTLAMHFMLQPDLAEGIRALLIDKTGMPEWHYKSSSEVPVGMIEQFFTKN